MAIEDEAPDVDEFDRSDLELAPETHRAQAEMAAERGETYDPCEVERRARDWAREAPDPIRDAEPTE